MTDFAKLKSSRTHKEAQRSFVGSAQKDSGTESSSGHKGPHDEHVIVDSSDAPEQHPSESLFASLPLGLEVRSSDSRGRGIWSKGHRRAGEVLLLEIPTVATLSTRYLSSHCSACFLEAEDGAFKRCPTCRLIYYCDSECQTRDWPMHKRECAASKKWAAGAPPMESIGDSGSNSGIIVASDAIRALGRILWKRQKKGRDSVWVKQMDAMQSHRVSLSSNEQTSELHTHMAHALVRYLGMESPNDLAEYGINSITALVDLISRFTTNAFTLTSPTLTPIGVCISPSVALFNHSCDPNAVLVFPRAAHNPKKQEPLLQIIAIKNIMPDEEIMISYIDSTLPQSMRQQALKETYHFTCECLLCSKPRKDGMYVDPREGMYCPKKCGGVCWLPTEENNLVRCTKCKAVVKDTDAVLDAVRIGQEAFEKATRIQSSDPQKAIQLTKNLIPILSSAGLLPSAHPLLAHFRLNTTLLITNFRSPFDSTTNIVELNSPQVQEEHQISQETRATSLNLAQEHLDDAIRSATRVCNGVSQVLVYGHPIRGLALAELGKLLSVDEPAPKHMIEQSVSVSPGSSSPGPSPKLVGSAPYPPSGPQRLKLAYETLVRARQELLVGFGEGRNEGGQVGQEVRKLLVNVESELGVWKDGINKAMADLPKTTLQK